jgi:hypothetical protein
MDTVRLVSVQGKQSQKIVLAIKPIPMSIKRYLQSFVDFAVYKTVVL